MNIKELLLPALLNAVFFALIFFTFRAGFRWIWPGTEEGSFVAPQEQSAVLPLKIEVDFLDAQAPVPATVTEVTTDYGTLLFSTDGAVLANLGFKKHVKNGIHVIQTVSAFDVERENGCFLVALDEKTPYYYRLVGNTKNDDRVVLTYQTAIDGGSITKIFTVFRKFPRIELQLKLEVRDGHAYAPRVLFPGPRVQEMGAYDVPSCLYGLNATEVRKVARRSLDEQQGWMKPHLFGADDKFFVHTLLQDEQQFCQRAYFKLFGQTGILSILEGPTVSQSASWNFSFYCGPKLIKSMAAVDPRLEKTLDYSGLMGPLAHWILALLNLVYTYIRNYGLAIILVALLIKLALFPLTWRAERARKKGAEYQRKLEYLQQRYKNDRELLEQQKRELLMREGLWNQIGGCLPMLAQLPIFWVLNRVISSSFELYKEPFFGWITDLSAKDPYYILPILLFLTIALSAVYVDAKQRLAMIMGAFVMGLFLTVSSAGLVLYFLTFNVLNVIQNEVQKKLK